MSKKREQFQTDDFGRIISADRPKSDDEEKSKKRQHSLSSSPGRGKRRKRSRSLSASRSRSPGRNRRKRSGSPPFRQSNRGRNGGGRSFRGRRDGSRRFSGDQRGDQRYSSRRKPKPKDKFGNEILTYREFLLTEKETHSPAEGAKLYKSYEEEFTKKACRRFFEAHREEDWFQELYSPSRAQERKVLNIGFGQNYNEFKQDWERDHDSVFVDLDAPGSKAEYAEHCAHVQNLSLSTSRSSILGLFEKSDGFKHMILRYPEPRSMARSAHVFYETAEKLQQAVKRFDGHQLDSVSLKVSPRTTIYSKLSAPAESLVESRVQKDLTQSLKLLKHLDQKRGLLVNFILNDDLIDRQSEVVRKLNLVISYLRRVHLFCYYCQEQFTDRDAMWNKCGEVHLRDPRITDKEWASKLDAKIPSVYEEKADVAPSTENKLFELHAKLSCKFFDTNVQKKTDKKYKCALCTKAFKGAEYVKKHITNKHKPEVAAIATAANTELYYETFFEFPDRSYPVIRREQPKELAKSPRKPPTTPNSAKRGRRRSRSPSPHSSPSRSRSGSRGKRSRSRSKGRGRRSSSKSRSGSRGRRRPYRGQGQSQSQSPYGGPPPYMWGNAVPIIPRDGGPPIMPGRSGGYFPPVPPPHFERSRPRGGSGRRRGPPSDPRRLRNYADLDTPANEDIVIDYGIPVVTSTSIAKPVFSSLGSSKKKKKVKEDSNEGAVKAEKENEKPVESNKEDATNKDDKQETDAKPVAEKEKEESVVTAS